MERAPVTSSNIKSVGYDAKASVLEIEFQNARVYAYDGVPDAVYHEMIEAHSAGRYFFGLVRGHYEVHEVTPVKQDALDKGGAPSN